MSNATAHVPVQKTDYADTAIQRTLVDATATYYTGALMALNASGLLTKCDDTAGLRFDGLLLGAVAKTTASGDAASTRKVLVDKPYLLACTIASASASDIGRKVYAKYDNEVAFSTSNSILVGTVEAVLSSTMVLIRPYWVSTAGVNPFDGEALTFTGATAVNEIVMPDNLAEALVFREGSNDYMTFVTTDSGEYIFVEKDFNAIDAVDISFGTGRDAGIRWSTADADNHALVIALGDSNQGLHITDLGAVATDWNIAATTHPNLYLHSNTTPATDYLRLGDHDGTAADIDVVGGTTLEFKTAGTTRMQIVDTLVLIGDTAHGGVTQGLVINQGASDDLIFALKSSDVATVLTTIVTGTVETDDYFTIQKFAAATGGAVVQGLGENAAVTTNFRLESYGGQADTTHSAAGRGLFEVYVSQHDGANALADIGADGNAFAVIGRRGSADATLFIVDEDGEIHSDVTLNVFDEHDDIQLVRAFDTLPGKIGALKNHWDNFVKADEQYLIDIGVLGAPLAQGGLMNHNRMLQLHNGCLWQLWSTIMDVVKALPESVQNALPDSIKNKLIVSNA